MKTDPMAQTNILTGEQRSRLERGDLVAHGDSLPRRIGRQLRDAYPAPETREDAFQSLLQKISTILP